MIHSCTDSYLLVFIFYCDYLFIPQLVHSLTYFCPLPRSFICSSRDLFIRTLTLHFLMHSHFIPLSIYSLSEPFPYFLTYRHFPPFIFIPIQRAQSLANHKFQIDNSSSKSPEKQEQWKEEANTICCRELLQSLR